MFPNRGRILWHRASEEATPRSPWIFQCDTTPSFAATDRHSDRYRINWQKLPEAPREVLKLQVVGAEAVLRALSQGLKLSFVPSRLVYVVIDEKIWAGPVRLVHKDGRWHLDVRNRELPVPTFAALPEASSADLYVDGQRRFLRHGMRPHTQIGELDWADDTLNLKRVLEWARCQPAIAQSLHLTKAVIKQVVEALPTSEQEILEMRIARARRHVEELARLAADTEAFEHELLVLPSVAERLAAAEREGRAAARAEAEAEAIQQAKAELEATRQEHQRLTQSLGEIRQALEAAERKIEQADLHAQAAVDAELARRRQELATLDARLAERRRQLEADVDLLDASLTERIAEITRRPSEALAQIAILRAALGAQVTLGERHPTTTETIAPPCSVLRSGEPQVEDQEQLVKAARRAAQAASEPPSLGTSIHGALLCGLVPVLSGPGALHALEAYGNVAVGGRVLTVTVPPTALEPADLLGRLDPSTRRMVVHPSGLLDLLIFANQHEQRERLFLVVLEGLNRAAADAYLLPILACYESARGCGSQRTLHLVHPAALAKGDAYAAAAQLAWPTNVLLAGTIIEGGATVPLPPAIWAHATLIQNGLMSDKVKLGDRETSPLTSAPALKWASWRSLASNSLQAGFDALGDLALEGFRLPIPVARAFARAYAAGSLRQPDLRKALVWAIRGVLVPYALSTGQLETLTEALEVTEIRGEVADLVAARQVLA